ncbi:MAG: MBL fold metallo-hydrolase [Bacteroidetes bacterium]|nr:MBL fold metallo-hydrolase [Bacteroidota bacterium]
MKNLVILLLTLFVFSCSQEENHPALSNIDKREVPGKYRFERVYGETPDGYPLPLTGKPITKQTVIVKNEDGLIKEYPQYYTPDEIIGSEEMRITCMGSGNPPVRMRQAGSSWLVQLGNGENFIFDIGGGAVLNLWSMGIPMAELDKLFVTHTHLDHVGGILPLYDAMGWARNTPLRVWGASGYEQSLGIAEFCKHIEKAANWHNTSKTGIILSGGMKIEANEFDFSKFSKENPRQLIYDNNGVKIYAFPVDHILQGAVGYRIEWNGLSFVYTGDSVPTSFEAEQSKGVDVFAHEMFIDAPTFAEKNSMPLQVAQNIVSEHTPPNKLGEIFSIAKPVLGVGTHYFTNDDTIDPAFRSIRSTYAGPVVIGQDLLVINVTKDQIICRMAITDKLMWARPAKSSDGNQELMEDVTSVGRTPSFVTETRLN